MSFGRLVVCFVCGGKGVEDVVSSFWFVFGSSLLCCVMLCCSFRRELQTKSSLHLEIHSSAFKRKKKLLLVVKKIADKENQKKR